MCHHYELREWEALRESIEEADVEDEPDEREEKTPAAPVADD